MASHYLNASIKKDSMLTIAFIFCLLCIAVTILALPFFWMVSTSLKPATEIAAYPPTWWPLEIRWQNYSDAWHAAPFGRFYWNSVVTSVVGSFLQVSFALTMAYALAWIPFPARPAILFGVLATMMIPDEMKLAPNYLTLSKLHLIDSYTALILVPAAHAFPVFVFYQHFRSLPVSLIEAATMDGASHGRILLQIAVPLSRPVLAATTVVAFVGRWNDYLWPLVVTNTTAMRTLPVGLSYLKESQEGGAQWNLLMAAAIFVIIPVIVLYALAQRHFIEGVARGALKG